MVEGADLGAIRFVDSPEAAVEGAVFIQESVPEQLPIKIEMYQRIEPHLGREAVLATSASGLLIKDMQAGWKDPSRFARPSVQPAASDPAGGTAGQ